MSRITHKAPPIEPLSLPMCPPPLGGAGPPPSQNLNGKPWGYKPSKAVSQPLNSVTNQNKRPYLKSLSLFNIFSILVCFILVKTQFRINCQFKYRVCQRGPRFPIAHALQNVWSPKFVIPNLFDTSILFPQSWPTEIIFQPLFDPAKCLSKNINDTLKFLSQHLFDPPKFFPTFVWPKIHS